MSSCFLDLRDPDDPFFFLGSEEGLFWAGDDLALASGSKKRTYVLLARLHGRQRMSCARASFLRRFDVAESCCGSNSVTGYGRVVLKTCTGEPVGDCA